MISAEQATEIELRLLLDAILAGYGYDFRGYATDVVARRLEAARLRFGASSLGDLQHRVLVDPELFAGVLDHLTLRVSDVFRDPGFYRALRHDVLPTLRTYPTLKVWLAGCANGEEVYSLAILLHEEGLLERATIYATDISADALREAKEGVYLESRLPTFVDNYQRSGGKADFSRYFAHGYDRLAMSDSLKRNVVFFQHDLVSDYSLGQMHLVFCRNVLIYFGTELRLRTLRLLRECLHVGGFLCLGTSEALPDALRSSLAPVNAAARIYRATEAA
ncbi:MAG TPA: CheR family methyltransferase [Polyangiaceae bacterium]|nr:CheR family methyltransferase [Polyangiaceae bacterium]